MPKRTSYAEGTPNWIDLSSTDVDGAKVFYAGLFGWSFEDQLDGEGNRIYSTASSEGQNICGLGTLPPEIQAQGVPSTWNTYFAADDVDATVKKAVAAGGSVGVEPMDVMAAGRMAFITDDQGAMAGLWQAGEHAGCDVVNEPGAFTWVEALAPDTEAVKKFYGDTLGLGSQVMDMGEMDYNLLTVGEDGVGGTLPPPMEQVPPHWHVYLGAADAAATVAKVNELGGNVVAGPMDTPVGTMATIKDPQGATFSIIQLNEWPE